MHDFTALERVKAGDMLSLEATEYGLFARPCNFQRGDVPDGIAINNANRGERVLMTSLSGVYSLGFDLEKYYSDLAAKTVKLMTPAPKKRIGILQSVLDKLQKLCKLQ
jgi:hypothetical protein